MVPVNAGTQRYFGRGRIRVEGAEVNASITGDDGHSGLRLDQFLGRISRPRVKAEIVADGHVIAVFGPAFAAVGSSAMTT